jgi:plasmid maintenance system antidote protein VapI
MLTVVNCEFIFVNNSLFLLLYFSLQLLLACFKMYSLKSKIEAIIQGLGVTPMRFADLIGVKRPVISHILSGRNKPSLDIVMKIVARFEELRFEWLDENVELDMALVQKIRDNNGSFYSSREFDESDNDKEESEISDSQAEENKPKKIDRIVFFFSDNSFKLYHPEDLGFA